MAVAVKVKVDPFVGSHRFDSDSADYNAYSGLCSGPNANPLFVPDPQRRIQPKHAYALQLGASGARLVPLCNLVIRIQHSSGSELDRDSAVLWFLLFSSHLLSSLLFSPLLSPLLLISSHLLSSSWSC